MTSPQSPPERRDEPLTAARFVADLRALGVAPGHHLGLGISFKSVSPFEGGPEGFIEALKTAVGPDGTLMVATFTKTYPLSRLRGGRVRQVFDPATTPSYTGLIPETMRRRSDALRSRHPTNSVTAIGAGARRLTAFHDETAGAYAPYSELAAMGGMILGIGVGGRLIGTRHEAQARAGLLDVVPYRVGARYRDGDGNVRVFVRRDKGGCVTRLSEFNPELERRGFVGKGRVGPAEAVLGPAKGILDTMTEILEKHPEANLCREADCLWCREVERRWDLYDRIDDPLPWQKNPVLRKLLAAKNALRLRDLWGWNTIWRTVRLGLSSRVRGS